MEIPFSPETTTLREHVSPSEFWHKFVGKMVNPTLTNLDYPNLIGIAKLVTLTKPIGKIR
jgi:hypothetical protein